MIPLVFLQSFDRLTNVLDYQEQFKNLPNRTGLSESFMVSCFIVGLEEEVRLGVQMFQPTSLFIATSLARLQGKNIATRKIQQSDSIQTSLPAHTEAIFLRSRSSLLQRWRNTETRVSAAIVTTSILQVAAAKYNVYIFLMAEKQRKKIWTKKQRQVQRTRRSEIEDTPEIPLHAISGMVAPQTMRVKRTIGWFSVIMSIDFGSTHNFINLTTAKREGMAIQKGGALEVMEANGERITSSGFCKKAMPSVQGISVSTDFYLLT